jgi:hypothetical protein
MIVATLCRPYGAFRLSRVYVAFPGLPPWTRFVPSLTELLREILVTGLHKNIFYRGCTGDFFRRD